MRLEITSADTNRSNVVKYVYVVDEDEDFNGRITRLLAFERYSIRMNYKLSVVAFILALISWLFIKHGNKQKWGCLRNLILINVSFAYIFQFQKFTIFDELVMYLRNQIKDMVVSALSIWLLMLALHSYSETLSYFRIKISKSLFNCNLYIWGILLMTEVVKGVVRIMDPLSKLYIIFVIKILFPVAALILNIGVYVKIVFYTTPDLSMNGGDSRQYFIATLICIFYSSIFCIQTVIQILVWLRFFSNATDSIEYYYDAFLLCHIIYQWHGMVFNMWSIKVCITGWIDYVRSKYG